MTQRYLTLFQLGPVQSFIASARRTQDLFVGSRLLSSLAKAGVEAVWTQSDVDLLFPAKLPTDEFPSSVPHRFAYVSSSPRDHADQVKAAVNRQWEAIHAKVREWLYKTVGSGAWEAVFDRQVRGWLEVYWVAVPYDDADHGGSYAAADKAIGKRKQVRHFPQVMEDGRKCTLTGAQSALPIDWGKVQRHIHNRIELRDNEALGAIATVKRFAQRAGCAELLGLDANATFRSTRKIAGNDGLEQENETNADLDFPYYAILHMDGDRMGKLIGEQRSLSDHQQLSEKLADFAENHVGKLVEGHKGMLVYAGGDDVLALLPLKTVLRCANDIREEYESIICGTMSAGIAIAAVNLPLDTALDEARLAEKRAKNNWGRNAVAIRDARSNAIRECGAKWQIGTVEVAAFVGQLMDKFDKKQEQLSGKLGFDMVEIGKFIASPDKALNDGLGVARRADLTRLVKRRISDKIKGAEKESMATTLVRELFTLAESPDCGWESASHWMILARFLARGGQR